MASPNLLTSMFIMAIIIVNSVEGLQVPDGPQVHEEVLEDLMLSDANVRIVREPFISPRYSKNIIKSFYPPVFDYQNARQQDHRKHRYAQQQLSDFRNVFKRSNNLRISLAQRWNVDDLKASSSKIQEDVTLNKPQPNTETNWDAVSLITTTRKPISNRKLNPESFFEDSDFESLRNSHVDSNSKTKINRQDDDNSPIVYVHPNLIQQQQLENNPSTQDKDLEALNALIGQNPNTQLEGLKRLLQDPQQNYYVLPPIKGPQPFQVKDHTPVSEQVVDIPNSQSPPNIDLNNLRNHQNSLEALQAQLDEVSKIQAQKFLEEAEKDAKAHVEAQHQAIAKYQADAQREAFAKIEAQNQEGMVLEDSKSRPSLALPLTYTPNVNDQALLRVAQVQNENQAILSARKEAERARLKKISITKTQSITKSLGNPKLVHEVVLESHHRKNALPVQQKRSHTDDHRQYAARYAFGYRIKDLKMGNDFGHEEKRDGKSAKGHYHVLLPDGRLQKVEYYADLTGYHAKVTYENTAHH